jgi:hypothetical protein
MQKHAKKPQQKPAQQPVYQLAYRLGKLTHTLVKKGRLWLSDIRPVTYSATRYPEAIYSVPALARRKNISLSSWYRDNVKEVQEAGL